MRNLVLCMAIFAGVALAQNSGPSAKPEASAQPSAETAPNKMSAEFCDAANKAFKAIRDDQSMNVNRKKQAALHDASAQAKTDAERNLSAMLDQFYADKINNNARRSDLQDRNRNFDELPEVKDMGIRERNCTKAIEGMLRDHTYSETKACSGVSKVR